MTAATLLHHLLGHDLEQLWSAAGPSSLEGDRCPELKDRHQAAMTRIEKNPLAASR